MVTLIEAIGYIAIAYGFPYGICLWLTLLTDITIDLPAGLMQEGLALTVLVVRLDHTESPSDFDLDPMPVTID